MSPSELIRNFVNLYNHPFTAELAAEMTAQEISLVLPILEQLHSDQTIKLISPEDGIYVRNNRYNPVVGYNKKGDWRFDQVAASALLDLIDQGQFKSIRAIANAFGRSRQWVFVYMEAMASIGIISMSGNTYKLRSRANLQDLGMSVESGILSRMRNTQSELQKRIVEERKEKRRQIRNQKKAEQETREMEFQQEKAKKEAFIQAWNDYLKSGWISDHDFQAYLRSRNNNQ
ncbi:MAG: hypothetical protein RBR69_01605 [Candidatus Cloacimonadaceae bacterium]|jgi:hypothetical protein|nr:hypothetical protein [Candidatus Cloacimonadota bacterium]MDY0126820.1 hypothetical protein [Candidatus Cloacimonadaceae bacterium]MCB5255063.1 hypothetical protein [Candidatus Cloacimonadota bacterium]MCK9177596.1 hypothetical protein [Candidatus Cloacimonadota bacterium]MCK9241651.1 hypothetical protein [Candidatus Cloacimonadota bacterium]